MTVDFYLIVIPGVVSVLFPEIGGRGAVDHGCIDGRTYCRSSLGGGSRLYGVEKIKVAIAVSIVVWRYKLLHRAGRRHGGCGKPCVPYSFGERVERSCADYADGACAVVSLHSVEMAERGGCCLRQIGIVGHKVGESFMIRHSFRRELDDEPTIVSTAWRSS